MLKRRTAPPPSTATPPAPGPMMVMEAVMSSSDSWSAMTPETPGPKTTVAPGSALARAIAPRSVLLLPSSSVLVTV